MLPTDAKKRKDIPIYSGFWVYFPDAIAAVAELSRLGNDQHNPGKPLFWDRSKSGDELDALARHLTDHAKGVVLDADGVMHLTKNAWRAMAALQKALEQGPVQTKMPATDYRSRWLMEAADGREWETTNHYTYVEVVSDFAGCRPILRLPAFDTTAFDDGYAAAHGGHPEACPCYTCAKARRDAAGKWE